MNLPKIGNVNVRTVYSYYEIVLLYTKGKQTNKLLSGIPLQTSLVSTVIIRTSHSAVHCQYVPWIFQKKNMLLIREKKKRIYINGFHLRPCPHVNQNFGFNTLDFGSASSAQGSLGGRIGARLGLGSGDLFFFFPQMQMVFFGIVIAYLINTKLTLKQSGNWRIVFSLSSLGREGEYGNEK